MDVVTLKKQSIKKGLFQKFGFWRPAKLNKQVTAPPPLDVWSLMSPVKTKCHTFVWSESAMPLSGMSQYSPNMMCRSEEDDWDDDSSISDDACVDRGVQKTLAFLRKIPTFKETNLGGSNVKFTCMMTGTNAVELASISLHFLENGRLLVFISSHIPSARSHTSHSKLYHLIKDVVECWGSVLMTINPHSASCQLSTKEMGQPYWSCTLFDSSSACSILSNETDWFRFRSVSPTAVSLFMAHMAQHEPELWRDIRGSIETFKKSLSRVNKRRWMALHFGNVSKFTCCYMIRHQIMIARKITSDELVIILPNGVACVVSHNRQKIVVRDKHGRLMIKLGPPPIPNIFLVGAPPAPNTQDSVFEFVWPHMIIWRCLSNPRLEGTVLSIENNHVAKFFADTGLTPLAEAIDSLASQRRSFYYRGWTGYKLEGDLQFAIPSGSPDSLLVHRKYEFGNFQLDTAHPLQLMNLAAATSACLLQDHRLRLCWYFANHIVVLYGKVDNFAPHFVLSALTFCAADPSTSFAPYEERDLVSFAYTTGTFKDEMTTKHFEFGPGCKIQREDLIIDRDACRDGSTTLPIIIQFVVTNKDGEQFETFSLVETEDGSADLNISRVTRNAGLRLWLGNVVKGVGTGLARKPYDVPRCNQILCTATAAQTGKLRETGFFAYKACLMEKSNMPCIVTLFVPPTAAVSNWASSDPKKRFSDVLVMAIDPIPLLPDGTLDGSFKPGTPSVLKIVQAALDPANGRQVEGAEFGIMCIVCGRSEKKLPPSDVLWVQHNPCNHVTCMECHALCMKSLKDIFATFPCPVCQKPTSKCKYLEQREIGDTDFYIDWSPGASELKHARSIHNPSFVYTIGQSIHISNFDMDLGRVCSAGVHAFVADANGECFKHVIQYGATNTRLKVTMPCAETVAVESTVPAQKRKQKTCETSADPSISSVAIAASSSTSIHVPAYDPHKDCIYDRSCDIVPLLSPSAVSGPSNQNEAIALWNQRDLDSPSVRSIYPTLEHWTQNPEDLNSVYVAHASTIIPMGVLPDDHKFAQCGIPLELPDLIAATFGSVPPLRPLLKVTSKDLIQWSPDPVAPIQPISAATVPLVVPTVQSTAPAVVSVESNFESQFPAVPTRPVPAQQTSSDSKSVMDVPLAS